MTSARTTLIVTHIYALCHFTSPQSTSTRISCKRELLLSHSSSVRQRNRSIQPSSTRYVQPPAYHLTAMIEHFHVKSVLLPTNAIDEDDEGDPSILPESISITRIDDLLAQMRFHEVPKRSQFSIPFELAPGFTIGIKGFETQSLSSPTYS